MRPRSFWRAGALVLATVATLVIAPSQSASADTIPPTQYVPVPLTDTGAPNYLLSQPDGSVTVGCAGGTNGTKRVSATGAVTQSIPNTVPYPNTCAHNAAVAADGTLFTVVTNASGQPLVEAIKGGTLKWTYSFSCAAVIRGMVMGTTGDVYVLAWCSGQNSVIGFKPAAASGATTPVLVLSAPVPSNVMDGGIAAYSGGLVLRTTTGIQYITYAGMLGSTFTPSGVLNGSYQEYADATLAGRVVVSVGTTPVNQQLCGNDTAVVGGIYAFESSGQKWGYNSLPNCSHVLAIRPTYTGGAVIHYDSTQGGIPGTPKMQHLLAVDANGKQMWTFDLTPNNPLLGYLTTTFLVDTNGNVAVQRRVRYKLDANGTSYFFPAVQLIMLSGFTGTAMAAYELSGDHTTPGGTGYDLYGGADISISHNTWYVPAVHCFTANNCSSGTAKLYAFTVPGLQMDYPRAAIVAPVTTANYVAMGDSYSSGEGVPAFDASTDTAGPPENRCHRSTTGSYARLLAGVPSTQLSLTKLVACSGATTVHIAGTWPAGGKNTNEPAQVSALSSSTKVVTISIGGNDVGFKGFVVNCLFLDCSDPANNQQFFNYISQTLSGKLTSAYNAIHTAAPNARVYVEGYPQLLSSQGCPQSDPNMQTLAAYVSSAHDGDPGSTAVVEAVGHLGVGLTEQQIQTVISVGTVEFSTTETTTARSLVQQMDQKVRDTVATINAPWLVYGDPLVVSSPFIGHELCTSQPYFNGLDFAHNEYSYHPNAYGQDAYRQLLLQLF